MTFLSKLFNRKRQFQNLENSEKDSYSEEEEDPEEEDSLTEEELQEETFSENSESDEEYEIVEREIHPAKIICPDCGGITLEGLEFCDKCGGELQ